MHSSISKPADAVKGYFWPDMATNDRGERLKVRLVCGFSIIIACMSVIHNLLTIYASSDLPLHIFAASLFCILLYPATPAVYYATGSLKFATYFFIANYVTHCNILIINEVIQNSSRELFLIAPAFFGALILSNRATLVIVTLVVFNLALLAHFSDNVSKTSAEVVVLTSISVMLGLWQVRDEFEKSNEELVVKRQEALAAAQAKTDFLANMSHEIRTPLNGISGVAQLLEDTELSDEQRELVNIGRNSGLSLLRLIDDILDYTKIAARGISLERIPTSPKNLTASVVLTTKLQAQERGLSIVETIAPEVPQWILADPTRLRQVVTNLVSNAIKFSHDGQVEIKIETHNEMLRVSVTDDGIGLTEEQLQRVFLKFEQASSATNREFGGTGLGLAISKELVELMGGHIGVTSTFGQGSTFWFCIPLEETEAPVSSKFVPLAETELNRLAGTEVLIVEDNRTNQLVAQRLLSSLKVSIQIAENGQDAVAICAKQRFDVIFMDIQMPVMGGIEATRLIRSSQGPNRETPIIALSANVLPEQQQTYRDSGMVACLGKPFRKGELAQHLLNVLPAAAPSLDMPA